MNFRHLWNFSYFIEQPCPASGTQHRGLARSRPGARRGGKAKARPPPSCLQPPAHPPVTPPAPQGFCKVPLKPPKGTRNQTPALAPITQPFSEPSPLQGFTPGFLGPKQAAGCPGAAAACAWPEARKLGGPAEQTALCEGWNRHKNDQSP